MSPTGGASAFQHGAITLVKTIATVSLANKKTA